MSTTPLANRYMVLGTLGAGAMGEVCRVLDLTSGRELALKVLTLPEGQAVTRDGALLRFKQEFRLMTQVRHPRCCQVHEFGLLPDGRPYFTMELVEGQGLDEVGPLPPARVRELLAEILLGLDAVHALGLVHRDLKSANVRIGPDGHAKLMDFGLMEVAGQGGGQIAGTLAYLAPEVVKRGPVDRRADLYALGCLAYELLTGQPPFVRATPVEVLRAQVHELPIPLSLLVPAIPADLELVVRRLLEKDPIDRFQGAFQVLDALGHRIPEGFGGTLLSSPMVGREPERDALGERLGRVAQGSPGGAVVLHGGAGMGKSRVLEELRFMTQLENLPLADAASFEHDATPYGPVVGVLRALWSEVASHAPLDAARLGGAIARIFPIIGIEPAPDLDAAGEKQRLHAAVADLLGALAKCRGLVVVLDDWHWAEPLSRELLEHVMRQLADAPALFVLASRYPAEGGLEWVGLVRAMPLSGLDAAGVRRMAATMLGQSELPEPFVAKIAELTGGVPFVLEGLLEHLVNSGRLRMRQGRWDFGADLGPEAVPRRLQAVIVGKLNDLPAGAQRVARVLAVHGREADLACLQRASGLSEDDLFAALEALERKQILSRQGGHGPARYRFAQDHFHEFLYANLGGEELSQLHADVGLALEATPGEAPLERVAALAHHFQRAGDHARTVRYALDAGQRHLELQALAPAERLLKAGLAALKLGGEAVLDEPADRAADLADAADRLKLQYLFHLARARRALGATHAAREALTEALALAERLRDMAMLAELQSALAQTHRQLANWEAALATGELALASFESRGDHAGAGQARLDLSRTHMFSNAPGPAVAAAEAALTHARAAGDPRLRSETLAHLGNLLLTYDAPRAAEGLAFLQEAVALLPELGDMAGLRNAMLLLGTAHAALGDHVAAKEAFGRSFQLSEEVGAEGGAVAALTNLALAALATGDFGDAVRMAQQAYNRAMRTQNTYVLGVSMLIEAIAASHLGRPAEALPLLRRALDVGRDLKHPYLELLALQGALEVYLLLGDLPAAREAATTLEGLLGRGEASDPAQRLLAARAELAARDGDLQGAARFILRAGAAGATAPGARLWLLRARARLAVLAEDWGELGVAAAEGVALAERLGARPIAAELHGLLGELALALGAGGAEAHFQASLDLAEAMGARLPRALALFGLAAARPYQPEAVGYAERARELVEALAAALPADARGRFVAYAERARVLDGNFIAFSLPRLVQRGTGPLLRLSRDGDW